MSHKIISISISNIMYIYTCIYIIIIIFYMYIYMYIHMYSTYIYIYIVPLEHALYLYSTLLNGTSGMWHQRPGNSWGNWWFGGFRLVIGVALNHPLLIGNFPYKPSSFRGTNLGNLQFLDDIFWETATSFRKRDFHLGYVSKNLGFSHIGDPTSVPKRSWIVAEVQERPGILRVWVVLFSFVSKRQVRNVAGAMHCVKVFRRTFPGVCTTILTQ